MKLKSFSIMLASILCAFSCAACGASKTDSSSVSQDSAVLQPDSISTEQGSEADESESITERLDNANNKAKEIYTALLSYSDKCTSNEVTIPDGELDDIVIIAANEDTAAVPAQQSETIEEAAADIQNAVSVSLAEAENSVFSVVFENGVPVVVVWSESYDSNIIGGYPNPATDTDWTLDDAGQPID